MSSELKRMAQEAEEIGKALKKRAKRFSTIKFATWESVRNLSNIVAAFCRRNELEQLAKKAKKMGEELEMRGGDFATWESVRDLSNIVAELCRRNEFKELADEAEEIGGELEKEAEDFSPWESVRDLSNTVAELCRKLDNPTKEGEQPGAETA